MDPTTIQRLHHEHGRLRLSIARIGKGRHHVILMHGYGLCAKTFFPFLQHTDIFTFHCVDQVFHGESPADLDVDVGIAAEEMSTFFSSYLEENDIGTVSLIGYSMGARICLILLERMPSSISQAYLLAPDGFYRSGWYRFAVGTSVGRAIFSSMPSQLSRVHRFADRLKSMGLLSQSRHALLHENAKNEQAAYKLYRTWMALRELTPDLHRVMDAVQTRDIHLEIHLGRYDRVIRQKQVENGRAKARYGDRITLHETGHRMLRSVIFEQIFSSLQTPVDS